MNTKNRISRQAYNSQQAYNDLDNKLTIATTNATKMIDDLLVNTDLAQALQLADDYKHSITHVINALRDDLAALDDVLTKVKYTEMQAKISKASSDLHSALHKAQRALSSRHEQTIKDDIYANSQLLATVKLPFQVDNNAKRRAFDVIYDQAYADAHASGFDEVRTRYDELEDMFINAMEALS